MLETIAWVYLGIIIGTIITILVTFLLGNNKRQDLEEENLHLRWINNELKEEIFRIENPSKPKPRKNRKR